jgi:hypothetical protein
MEKKLIIYFLARISLSWAGVMAREASLRLPAGENLIPTRSGMDKGVVLNPLTFLGAWLRS